MKTALIQTEIWKSETIFRLNIDTKLLYLHLTTSPERNTTRYFRQQDRFTGLYIGLTEKALEVCKAQLEDLDLIFFREDWVILGDQGYVRPTKGKLSQKLYFEDLERVPGRIKAFARNKGLVDSGATPEHPQEYNNNNNNKEELKVIHSEDQKVDRWRKADCDQIWEETEAGDVIFKT